MHVSTSVMLHIDAILDGTYHIVLYISNSDQDTYIHIYINIFHISVSLSSFAVHLFKHGLFV